MGAHALTQNGDDVIRRATERESERAREAELDEQRTIQKKKRDKQGRMRTEQKYQGRTMGRTT